MARYKSRDLCLTPLEIEPGRTADASLHVFEVQDRPSRHAAVYVDRKLRGKNVLAWTLGSGLAELLDDGLATEVERAHGGLGYAALTSRLTSKLFPTAEPDAVRALAALRSHRGLTPRRRVLTRVVDGRGRLVVLPFALLDRGDGEPMRDGIDFLQPLPDEKGTRPAGCLATWKKYLPELVGPPQDWCKAGSSASRADQLFDDFKGFVGSGKATDPEGLLVLAHHGSNQLSFNSDYYPFATPSDVGRTFAPGSAALLLACDVQRMGGDGRVPGWIDTLSVSGVGAALASPFTVPGEFGQCLARHLRDAIDEARTNGHPNVLLGVFKVARERVVRDLKADDGRKALADLVYELVLAGNPSLEICQR